MTRRGPGVEKHQAAHQAPGPASCGWEFGRPSRLRSSAVLLCAESAVARDVEVFRFAGHDRSSTFLVDSSGAEYTGRRPNTSLPPYDRAVAPVVRQRRDGPHVPVEVQQLPSAGSRMVPREIVGPVCMPTSSPTSARRALRCARCGRGHGTAARSGSWTSGCRSQRRCGADAEVPDVHDDFLQSYRLIPISAVRTGIVGLCANSPLGHTIAPVFLRSRSPGRFHVRGLVHRGSLRVPPWSTAGDPPGWRPLGAHRATASPAPAAAPIRRPAAWANG